MNPILDAFVTAELLRLSVKYNCKPPRGPDEWIEIDVPAFISPFGLEVSTKWDKAFERDPIGTFPMLRHTIAHEFRHWMTYAKHFAIPLPRGPRWTERRKEYQEMTAKEFAKQETGITVEEAWTWWEKVTTA